MTCRPSEIHWRDALYNSVRKMPGGVVAAAAYLSARRGKNITSEALRKKLRGVEGESVSFEIAELLTEWMQELAGGRLEATVWIQSLAAQFGMAVDAMPEASGDELQDAVAAINTKVMRVSSCAGRLSGVAVDTLQDGHVSASDANELIAEARSLRSLTHRLERIVRRALGKRAGSA